MGQKWKEKSLGKVRWQVQSCWHSEFQKKILCGLWNNMKASRWVITFSVMQSIKEGWKCADLPGYHPSAEYKSMNAWQFHKWEMNIEYATLYTQYDQIFVYFIPLAKWFQLIPYFSKLQVRGRIHPGHKANLLHSSHTDSQSVGGNQEITQAAHRTFPIKSGTFMLGSDSAHHSTITSLKETRNVSDCCYYILHSAKRLRNVKLCIPPWTQRHTNQCSC